MATRLTLIKQILFSLMLPLLSTLATAVPDHFRIPMHQHRATKTPDHPVMNVVMVHGLFETGYSFRTMRNRLQERNARCFIARLKPSDARQGVDTLAAELKRQIDSEFGPDARISIVGFSMGGLVSRYYLQELGGAKRCDRLITISSPHQGSRLAHCLWGKGGRQMEPDSDFIKALEASEDKLGDMPVSSLRTPLDVIILPSTRSIWPRAENRSYVVTMHPMMLSNHRVLQDVERQLLGNSLNAR